MANTKVVDGKIEAILRKQAALKAALAERRVQVQKKRDKDEAKLSSIIGSVVVQNAGKHTDYELILRTLLQTTAISLSDGDKKLLRSKGWL